MREILALPLVLPLTACLQIGTGAGARPGDGGASSSLRAPATDAGPSGANCFEDPATHAVLCEAVDVCPSVVVDPALFPDCGFRLRPGGSLDLECLCGSALCPVGVPSTCAQAKMLLEGQSALLVCEQQADGRCVELGVPDAGASTCDTVCRGDCAGDPGCLRLCGC